jgi:Na+/H+ antiporter NhaC
MKTKNLLFTFLLVLVSFAAYAFLFNAQMVVEASETVDGISEQIRSVAEPMPSPDVRFLKGVIQAFINLLPAS